MMISSVFEKGDPDMQTEKCISCGYAMFKDSFTDKLYCPVCGGSESYIPQITMEDMETKSEEGTPSSDLLKKLLGSYKVSSTKELMDKVSGSPTMIKILLSNTTLKNLSGNLLREDNRYVIYLNEYCSLCLAGANKSIKEIMTEKKKIRDSVGNYKSSFKQMDVEEEAAMMKRQKREVQESPYGIRGIEREKSDGYLDFFEEDMMYQPDYSGPYEETEYESTLSGLLDYVDAKISSWETYDRVHIYVGVEEDAFKGPEFEKSSEETKEDKKTESPAPPEDKDDPQFKEKLQVRKDELMRLIEEEERRILDKDINE